MAKTFQRKSEVIGFENCKAAKHDAGSMDALIVYDMDFHLKSEHKENAWKITLCRATWENFRIFPLTSDIILGYHLTGDAMTMAIVWAIGSLFSECGIALIIGKLVSVEGGKSHEENPYS